MHHDVKISGAQIRTHDLWIWKRVCYPLHHSASNKISEIESTLSSSLPSSTDWKADWETLRSASRGHSVNQSIVQQLTRDGNIRQRVRNALPTGLMASTMWRLFLLDEEKLHNIVSVYYQQSMIWYSIYQVLPTINDMIQYISGIIGLPTISEYSVMIQYTWGTTNNQWYDIVSGTINSDMIQYISGTTNNQWYFFYDVVYMKYYQQSVIARILCYAARSNGWQRWHAWNCFSISALVDNCWAVTCYMLLTC